MLNSNLPPNATVDQEVDWYKAELGTWDNLDKAWDPSFKTAFKRLSGEAIQTIIMGSEPPWSVDIRSDAFGMAGAYQRLITTEQLSAMSSLIIKIIYPSIVLSDDLDFSKLGYFHTFMLATYLDTSLAADDPQARWVSKITLEQVSKLNTGDGYECQSNLYTFWTNPKNLSTNADVALPYLESLREKIQALGGKAIAIAMGNYYDDGEKFAKSNIDPRVSQLLTTKQTNDSFKHFRISSEGISRWLEQNFKDIAALKRKDVVIQDLSTEVVNAMAVELNQTSQVNGEFGYWVWSLTTAQIQGLTIMATVELFKAWVGKYDWTGASSPYIKDGVVEPTLVKQFQAMSGFQVDAIARQFGLARPFQYLLSPAQINDLSAHTIVDIFPAIASWTSPVMIAQLNHRVVRIMAIHLDRVGQVYGEYGYWVWGLSDAQIKSLSPDAGLALFKAWLSDESTDETYSPNEVVNATLARQFQNFSGQVIENIIQKDFGVAARYQWLLSAEQLNELSLNSLSRIFGTIAQRTDLTSGLSNETVNKMAILLEQQGQGLGQVNGKYGHWVWGLSDQQVKGLSTEAGLALFKAWVSHDWLDETYSPNEVVNDTLARQFKNFSSDIVNTIIKTDFGLAARYQWLLSAEQVNGLESNSISAIGLTIKRKFKYDELSKSVWDVLGVKAEPVLLDQQVDYTSLNQPTINANASSLAELLIHRMASATNVPSANTNVFNPNASLGASTSNQALVAAH